MPNNWQVFHMCTIDVYFKSLMFQHCLNILLFTLQDCHVPICTIQPSTPLKLVKDSTQTFELMILRIGAIAPIKFENPKMLFYRLVNILYPTFVV